MNKQPHSEAPVGPQQRRSSPLLIVERRPVARSKSVNPSGPTDSSHLNQQTRSNLSNPIRGEPIPAALSVPSAGTPAHALLRVSREALRHVRQFSQDQVDSIAHAFALAVYDDAEKWAKLAVAETGLGNVPDKIHKNRAKVDQIWNQVKYEKTVGIIEHVPERRIIRIAEPVGVIAGVPPCTNPVVTAMIYAILCIKTRNALVVLPHPRAAKVTELAIRAMVSRGAEYGLPEEAIQVLSPQGLAPRKFLQLSREIMALADMIIPTRDPSILAIPHQFGRHTPGVGGGNTPVIVHPTANFDDAALKIVEGRSFDNRIVCASEQSVVVPAEIFETFKESISRKRAAWIEGDAIAKIEKSVLDASGAKLSAEVFGKDALKIACLAGIEVAPDTRVLVLERNVSGIGKDPLSSEKLFPLLTVYRAADFRDCIAIAKDLLKRDGAGHTAVLHIEDNGFRGARDMREWLLSMPATHLIINQLASASAGCSRVNGVIAETTLGVCSCGRATPMGSVELSVKQLLNYKMCCMPVKN